MLLDILGPEIVRQPISNLVATSQGTNPDQGEIIPSPAEDDVHYEYYEGEWNNLPNFDSLTPVITGRLPEISLVPATRDDFYALRFTTQIELPATGAYTFYLKSDDGSELMVNGQTVVNHDGLHNARATKSGTVNLAVGVHGIVVTFFEKTGSDSLLVQVEGPQVARQALSNLVSSSQVPVNPVVPVDPVEPVAPADSSVFYEYFEGDWNLLPDFNALTPVATGQQAGFSLAPATRDERYGFRFTTRIDLPSAGEYTFYLKSDDGSKIKVNGQTVVDNDGLHGARLTKSGSVSLGAGLHDVEVMFFEKTGRNSLLVEFEGPQTARQALSNFATLQQAPVASAPIVDPLPLVPNLLANGQFDDQKTGWIDCASDLYSSVEPGVQTTGNVLKIENAGCLFQEFPVTAGNQYQFQCVARVEGTQFSSITYQISDVSFNQLIADELVVDGTAFQSYTSTITAPASGVTGVVTFYSEDTMRVANCTVEAL